MRSLSLRSRRRVADANLYLPSHLAGSVESEAEAWAPLETGGMLLGYREGSNVVVQNILSAGPGAVRGASKFEPDGAWQQTRLDKIYEQSGRITTYLGDWHSHPRGGARPSKTDRETYQRVADEPESRAPNPVILIAAVSRTGVRCEAHVLHGSRVRELPIVVFDEVGP